MRDTQAQTILASFTQHGRKRTSGKILELVDVEKKVATGFFGDVGAGHRSLLDAADQKRAEKRRVVFAESAFAEVHNQHMAVVHNLPQVERPAGCAHDGADTVTLPAVGAGSFLVVVSGRSGRDTAGLPVLFAWILDSHGLRHDRKPI